MVPADLRRGPVRPVVHADGVVELRRDAQRDGPRREEEAPRHEVEVLGRLRR